MKERLSVEAFARTKGIAPEYVIRMIRDGVYQGEQDPDSGEWFIVPPISRPDSAAEDGPTKNPSRVTRLPPAFSSEADSDAPAPAPAPAAATTAHHTQQMIPDDAEYSRVRRIAALIRCLAIVGLGICLFWLLKECLGLLLTTLPHSLRRAQGFAKALAILQLFAEPLRGAVLSLVLLGWGYLMDVVCDGVEYLGAIALKADHLDSEDGPD
jgi:hypothetical protein